MFDLLLALVPLLLVDLLNPVLFAMLVFAAGSIRPVLNSSALLIGHTVAYFGAGIAISLGLEQITGRLANPERLDFILGGLVGIGLVWLVLPTKRDGAPRANEPEMALTPVKCLGLGAVINFVGIPFALPYFAVVDQLLKANLATTESLGILAIYNFVYALPFMIVPVAVAISGAHAQPLLAKINDYLVRLSDVVMPWMLGLLGLALIADSAVFFYRGQGLWQF